MRYPSLARRGAAAPVVPLLAVLALAAAAMPASAQDLEQIWIRDEALAADLHLLTGAGGNMLACTGPQGILLVDADYEQMAGKLLAALDSLGSGPVRLVVDTHWHFDHVGGHAALAAAGALIASHPNTRRYLAAGGHLDVIDRDVPPADPAVLPTVTIPDSLTLHWGDETVRVLHPGPGHTGGDLVLRFERADVVHAGDLFFNFGYPFIDTAHGGGIDGLLAAVDRVLALCGPATRIVPGHGPPATPAELADYRDVLRRFRDLVAAEMDAGRSLEQIVADRPTRELDELYGDRMFPPAAFAEMVWLSLGGDRP